MRSYQKDDIVRRQLELIANTWGWTTLELICADTINTAHVFGCALHYFNTRAGINYSTSELSEVCSVPEEKIKLLISSAENIITEDKIKIHQLEDKL